MSYIDIFNQRNSDYGNSIKNVSTNATKRNIITSFKNSPSYYQVQVNTPTTPLASTPLDAWIVDDSNTQDLKQIQLIPNQTLNYGDLINWQGDYWLTTQVDYMGGIYYRGSIQKCYSSLKWLDDTGVLRESYFTITSNAQRSVGLNDGTILIMPNERRYIAIQNNEYTKKITKTQKFILDSDRSWRVSSINTLFTGLIHLELEEILVNNKDNTTSRVADNSKRVLPTDPTKLF